MSPKKKYIFRTNHDGGAHFGHPHSCTHVPTTNRDGRTDHSLHTLILYTLFRYQSRWTHEKHTLGTPTRVRRQRLRRNTSPLPVTTAAPTRVQLSYSRNFYSISTYVTGHVTLGSA